MDFDKIWYKECAIRSDLTFVTFYVLQSVVEVWRMLEFVTWKLQQRHYQIAITIATKGNDGICILYYGPITLCWTLDVFSGF
jgi:hypothetical protein